MIEKAKQEGEAQCWGDVVICSFQYMQFSWHVRSLERLIEPERVAGRYFPVLISMEQQKRRIIFRYIGNRIGPSQLFFALFESPPDSLLDQRSPRSQSLFGDNHVVELLQILSEYRWDPPAIP